MLKLNCCASASCQRALWARRQSTATTICFYTKQRLLYIIIAALFVLHTTYIQHTLFAQIWLKVSICYVYNYVVCCCCMLRLYTTDNYLFPSDDYWLLPLHYLINLIIIMYTLLAYVFLLFTIYFLLSTIYYDNVYCCCYCCCCCSRFSVVV